MTTTKRATVRRAREEDLPALVDLRILMFEAMDTPTELLDDARWRAGASAWFAARLADPDTCLVVAELDGTVVASAVGEVTRLIPSPGDPRGCVGLLSNVATLPEARGQGLASAVTDEVLTWFEGDTDVARVDLFATTEGLPLYERREFEQSRFPAMRRTMTRPS